MEATAALLYPLVDFDILLHAGTIVLKRRLKQSRRPPPPPFHILHSLPQLVSLACAWVDLLHCARALTALPSSICRLPFAIHHWRLVDM